LSLHDRPTVAELLAAVRAYLLEEVAAQAGDRRARFRALIAANVLAISERELATSADDERAENEALRSLGCAGGTVDERRQRVCEEIRSGRYDDPARFGAALEYARRMVERKLAIANPRFKRSS